jgi:rhomboid family GlyGly-CTERM serine protease
MVFGTAKITKVNFPKLTTLFFFIAVVAFIIEPLGSLLVYEREKIINGEIWRLVTGHFVHFSLSHLLLNSIAFVLLSWLLEDKKSTPFFFWFFLWITVSISSVLFALQDKLEFFAGLSGVAHANIYYLALIHLRTDILWQRLSLIVLIVLPIKVVLEFSIGSLVLGSNVEKGFVTEPLSHLVGLLSAVVFLLYEKFRI